VQHEILQKHRSAPLRVEVIWLPMLAGDSRQLIDQRVLSDPRVTYYWDSNRIVGDWFSHEVTQAPGTTWDAFFLYGAQARWESTPRPLVASGSTIIGAKDDLLKGVNQLWASATLAAMLDRLLSARS
jgi:hypothetical protein